MIIINNYNKTAYYVIKITENYNIVSYSSYLQYFNKKHGVFIGSSIDYKTEKYKSLNKAIKKYPDIVKFYESSLENSKVEFYEDEYGIPYSYISNGNERTHHNYLMVSIEIVGIN